MIPYIYITLPSYGLLACSKLVFGITQLPQILMDFSWAALVNAFVFGGLVLYGGLLGGLAGAAVFARWKRCQVLDILNYVIPGFVLFHAFGRIGCLLAGYAKGLIHHVSALSL